MWDGKKTSFPTQTFASLMQSLKPSFQGEQGLKEKAVLSYRSLLGSSEPCWGCWRVLPSHAAPQTIFLLEAIPYQALASRQRASSAVLGGAGTLLLQDCLSGQFSGHPSWKTKGSYAKELTADCKWNSECVGSPVPSAPFALVPQTVRC